MWRYLTDFTLTSEWQLSEPIRATSFRLRHTLVNPYAFEPIALVCLAYVSPETGETEVYNSQKIVPRLELEVVSFPFTPSGSNWIYSFAIKQPKISDKPLPLWNISVDMALYPLDSPPSQNAKPSNFTSTTVLVGSSPIKVASANPDRKKTSFHNPNKDKTISLDITSSVTADTAQYSIPPRQTFVDEIGWAGEFYAVSKTGDVNLIVREFS